ncbi:hypothetical protein GQ53DRAFT_822544 [Thozetella sp. PMI_491]|nr:hypothetical protein GQ53DRAFT_822544 [Thozetella sp. PMI_491]
MDVLTTYEDAERDANDESISSGPELSAHDVKRALPSTTLIGKHSTRITIPYESYIGAILGGQFQIGRLIRHEVLEGGFEISVYEVVPLLFTAVNRLEAKAMSVVSDPGLRRMCQRKIAHLKKILVATIDQAGKKWLVYNARDDYELPTKRMKHTRIMNSYTAGLPQLQQTLERLPSAIIAEAPLRRVRRRTPKKFNNERETTETIEISTRSDNKTLILSDLPVPVNHRSWSDELKSLQNTATRLRAVDWDPNNMKRRKYGLAFKNDRELLRYIRFVVINFRDHEEVDPQTTYLPSGWSRSGLSMLQRWRDSGHDKWCHARNCEIQTAARRLEDNLKMLSRPVTINESVSIANGISILQLRRLCEKAEVAFSRPLVRLALGYELHDLRELARYGDYQDSEQHEFDYALRKGLSTRQKKVRVGRGPKFIKLPQRFMADALSAGYYIGQWEAILETLGRGELDAWISDLSVITIPDDLSVPERMERAYGLDFGIFWPSR